MIRRIETATSFVTKHLAAPRLHIAVGVESFGIFARDNEIELAAAQMEPRIGSRRADVGEQIEAFSEHHRRVDLAACRVLELESRCRAEDNPVGLARFFDDIGVDGTSERTKAGVADRRLLDAKSERKSVGSGTQYRERGGGNFGTDTVTRENEEIHLSGFQCECGAIFSNFGGKKSRSRR